MVLFGVSVVQLVTSLFFSLAADCAQFFQTWPVWRAVAAAGQLHTLGGHFSLHSYLWHVFCLSVVSTSNSIYLEIVGWNEFLLRAKGQGGLCGIHTIWSLRLYFNQNILQPTEVQHLTGL